MKSKIFALLLGLLAAVSVSAQIMPTTTYFMDKNPLRHTLNPAFHTMDKFYVGMPAFSLFKFGVGNNALSFEDVYQPRMVDGKNTTVLFLNPAWENGRQSFLYAVQKGVNINTDFNLQLLSCGFKIRPIRSYVTLGMNLRLDSQILFPEAFWLSILGGGLKGNQTENHLALNELFIGTNAYIETALGYTFDLNDKWSFGIKAKHLLGLAAVRTDFKNLDIVLGKDEWKVTGNADVYASVPCLEITATEDGKVDETDFNTDNIVNDVLKNPSGKGFAVDLGATFRPVKRIQVSAAVLDLGGINYKNNLHRFSKGGDFVFDGLEYDINNDDFDSYMDKYTDMFEDMYLVNPNPKSFRYKLYPKMMLAGECGFWKNRVSVGLLSKTTFAYEKALEELMLSANFKPLRTISFSASYSLLDGAWSNLGFGLNLNLGAFNWFLIADQIPLRFAKGSDIMIPTRTKYFDFAMGMNFAIRDKKAEKEAKEAQKATDVVAEEDVFAPVDSVALDKPLFDDEQKVAEVTPFVADSMPSVFADTVIIATADTVKPVLPVVDSVAKPDDVVFVDTVKAVVADTTPVLLDTTPVVKLVVADTTPVLLDTTPAVKPVVADTTPVLLDTTPAVKPVVADTIPVLLDTTPVVKPVAVDTIPVVAPEQKPEPVVQPESADSAYNIQVLEREQPGQMIAVVEGELIEEALYGIKFSNNAGEMAITKTSYPILNKLADRMLVNPTFTLEIKGHYFLENDGSRNRFYGKQRALLVKWYLTERGIDPSRMDVEGVGAAYPVGPNNTLEEKKKNTRMELRLFK